MRKRTLWAALGLLILAGSVQAGSVGTITAKFDGVTPRKSVHVRYGDTYWVWAGLHRFTKLAIDPNDVTNPAFGLNTTFSGYCIDLVQPIYDGQVWTWDIQPLVESPEPGPNMDPTVVTYLSRLWGGLYEESAEFQVAVWELVNENPANGYNIYAGDHFVPSLYPWEEVDRPAINAMLDTVTDPGYSGATSNLVWALVHNDAQDIAVLLEAGSQPAVPEPLTLAGLLMGVGGLVRYGLKRRTRLEGRAH